MDTSQDNWPLVSFTSLAPVAVGGLIGLLLLDGTNPGGGTGWGTALPGVVSLLALGTSLLHLGRPLRAYRAAAGLSTSWLSREVMLFGLFTLGLMAYWLPVAGGPWGQLRGLVAVAAAILGVLGLLATGEVYRLPSRPGWDHWTTVVSFALGALSAGLPFGLFAHQLDLPGQASSGGGTLVVAVGGAAGLLLALAVTWLRRGHLLGGPPEAQHTWQLIVGPYRWALTLRVGGALLALAMLALGGTAAILAWVPAALGEVSDRILFFRATVPVSFSARAGAPAYARRTRERA